MAEKGRLHFLKFPNSIKKYFYKFSRNNIQILIHSFTKTMSTINAEIPNEELEELLHENNEQQKQPWANDNEEEAPLEMAISVHPIKERVESEYSSSSNSHSATSAPKPATFRWFMSYRMLTASMLCLCFASVHMMNANLGMAMVCMVAEEGGRRSISTNLSSNSNISEVESSSSTEWVDGKAPRVHWSSEDQGWIFATFNAGLLCMLFTGFLADKFNAKYMIILSVLLASFANFGIPLTANRNVGYAIGARFLVGLAEALLQPAINSLVTRWFPASERSYALGLATGGRQFGTLLIVPTAGALCAQSFFFGGWPSIFYVSAFTGLFFVLIYLVAGADKPSKQNCISSAELTFITVANTPEHMGQKRINRKVPWKRIFTSSPVWAALVSVVCHEFPLMTMIMFLPAYLHDVHHYESTQNGIFSALPTLALWISKVASSWLNTWLQRHTEWGVSYISKFLNGIGSVGLALFMLGATFLDSSRASLAVVFLCFSMFFTGLHTPGCQAALVAIAPAFSGAITGLTFFFVAISGMINPAMTKLIVRTGSAPEWNIVFYISTVIALIPVFVFSWWGSADVQPWARSPSSSSVSSCPTLATIESMASAENIKNGGIQALNAGGKFEVEKFSENYDKNGNLHADDTENDQPNGKY